MKSANASGPAVIGDQNLSDILPGGIFWDNHGCMPLRPDDEAFLPQLERVRTAGLHVLVLNVGFGTSATRQSVSRMIESFCQWILARPEHYVLVERVEDALLAQSTGRLGVCFDLEGMDALEGNPELVGAYYERGVRWMLASYNKENSAGGGCLAEDHGLTAYGRQIVRTMNDVGMVVCGSHCGYRTARELIDLSAKPVIFSHSNPRAVCNHPRNIPDELMRACALRGGVIGINGFGPFLGDNDASIDAYVTHLKYALDLVGEDHVGVGLDYVFDVAELNTYIKEDPSIFPPALYAQGAQMLAPWQLPNIASLLLDRGHRQHTVKKIFGGNFLRIAREVWR